MKNLKPYLKSHISGKEAVERTKHKNVTAVAVKTYSGETLQSEEFYSYKTNGRETNLFEDFPLCLASNQTIEEINANDY